MWRETIIVTRPNDIKTNDKYVCKSYWNKKVIKSMTKDKSHGIYVSKNASETKH